jgi:hypothetical protein
VLRVNVSDLVGRNHNEESARGFLAALRAGLALDAVPVFGEPACLEGVGVFADPLHGAVWMPIASIAIRCYRDAQTSRVESDCFARWQRRRCDRPRV